MRIEMQTTAWKKILAKHMSEWTITKNRPRTLKIQRLKKI